MKRTQALLAACIALMGAAFHSSLHARAMELPSTDIDASDLARDSGWLRLVHYEKSSAGDGWVSAIHSPEFFLAGEAGRRSPTAELIATVEAMRAPAVEGNPNQHAQCRFPARLTWLRDRLNGQIDLPSIPCPNWDNWSRHQTIDTVTVVLATGYLGNPASYYGHTLLKFESSSADQARPAATGLRDLTVNYGAIIPKQDDPVTYIVKGIFGGYDGGFSDIDYYFHRSQYGENELRDLWEYQLELTPAQARQVAAHAWEVTGKKYQYFFFRRNCAFRMAELVQILDGVDIIPEKRPWTVPQSVIQKAAQQRQPNGLPLIRQVRYQPSRQSRYYARYHLLQPDEQEVFLQLATKNGLDQQEGFQRLPLNGKQAVLDTLIDYHLFRTDPKDREAGTLHPMYSAALAERYRLPPGSREGSSALPTAPHLGRKPGWLQLGWTHQEKGQERLSVRVRPAYYDPLDSDSGHIPHSALSMGDITLSTNGRDIRLDRLDLMAIESVNPGVTGLPGDQGEAWRIKAGAEPQQPGCTRCLTARVQADIGYGRRLTPRTYVSALIGGAVQENRQGAGLGFTRATAQVIWRPAPQWGSRASVEYRQPIDSPMQPFHILRGEARYAFHANQDLRLTWEHSTGERGGTTLRLGLGVYW